MLQRHGKVPPNLFGPPVQIFWIRLCDMTPFSQIPKSVLYQKDGHPSFGVTTTTAFMQFLVWRDTSFFSDIQLTYVKLKQD